MEELELLENRELRESLMQHCEVLDKVKELLLLPGEEVATIKQVAAFYGVVEETVKTVYLRNKEELDSDGVYTKKYAELLKVQIESLKTSKGKATVTFKNGDVLDFPNRGLRVFPRRAILRVGMLLRDSEVAKEVRTQLLNIEEKTAEEVKMADITEEQQLYLEIGQAYGTGDPDQIMLATAKLTAFKNRHIQQLETDNKGLAGQVLEWKDRSKLNAAVRKLGTVIQQPIGSVWSELYTNLLYKYSIDLKKRNFGKKPYIANVKENEWDKVLQVFCALCEHYEQSPSDMFQHIVAEA